MLQNNHLFFHYQEFFSSQAQKVFGRALSPSLPYCGAATIRIDHCPTVLVSIIKYVLLFIRSFFFFFKYFLST